MDDLEFVHKFVKGDIQAREEFLKRYSRLIYNYIYHVLTVKGLKDYLTYVDDIFQGFVLFVIEDDCKRLKSFKARNNCTFATWIRQLTINFTRDYLRKIKPLFSIDAEINDEQSLKDILADNSLPVRESLSIEERLRVLDYCIDLLTRDEKYFLELNFNQGVSLEVLRDYFKVSRGAIDMQKNRIIKKLKECFKGKGFLS
ncbi:MAG: RNA polymerase sigma factor SigW [Candidatus Omnitrophica bacterium ADurb.Bin205]|nr:MAG: RNA polymerase sigma factor SigW [Candidatus Omnitrophica bacterium ADurb.Bin205]